jgi:hypothetical protein
MIEARARCWLDRHEADSLAWISAPSCARPRVVATADYQSCSPRFSRPPSSALASCSAAQSPAACLSAVLCYLMVWPSVTPFRVARDNSLKLFLIRTTRFGVEHVLLTVGGRRVNHYGSGLCIQAPHLLVNRVDAEVWPQICPSFGPKACGSRFISLLKGDHPLSPIS